MTKKAVAFMVSMVMVVFLMGSFTITSAQTKFQANHPRRAQVNKRLNNQNKRISNKVKNGTMSKGQAHQLRQNDKNIRSQERSDAAANGGHITKQEQRGLNQQENQNSRAIHNQ
jgi:hypothetical protein